MKSEFNMATMLSNLGIEALNPMQQSVPSVILRNNNILLLSPTGTGKTLAFLLPVFELLQPDIKTVQCLIITPSRELALQIEQVWKKMVTGYKVNVCIGGHSMETEIKNLSTPPALLIGTPGRIADHLERRSFRTDTIKTWLLDEFDKSLQLGFHEQMTMILQQLRHVNKRILVSATSNVRIPEFTEVVSPIILDYTGEKENNKLSFKIVVSDEKDKVDCLFHLVCSLNSEPALIFCNHRDAVERTSEELNNRGIRCDFYHGGMDQDDRERALIRFRNGSIRYLVTTDLAARGLDIPEMKHVIHYHLPSKENEFIHRNGRTARMLASGTAYLVLYKEEKRPDYIKDLNEELNVQSASKLPDPPEFQTIYISGGKKNKLNKSDIAGFFFQKGKLGKDDLGQIEVKDFVSFVAVKTTCVKNLFHHISGEKMKGKKYKIEIAR